MNPIDKKKLASSIRDKYFPDSTFIGPYEAAGYHVPICEEQWLWLNRDKIKGVVLDMSTPRFWHEFIYDLEGVTRVLISEYGSEEVSKYGKSSRADIVGDFCRTPPPLEPNSVDTVLCLSILEHCEDMLAMFRNIFTILKPGGNAFFWTPYAYVDGHLTPDYWRIGRDGYRLLAKKTGFKMIDERNFGDMGKYLINDFGIDASANKAHRGIPIAFAIICSKPSETSTRASKPHVECPVCKSTYDEFAPYGATPRGNALCPNCGSLERHRLLWLFLEQKTNLFKANLKVLDIAPTRGLSEIFKSMRNLDYLSIDKNSPVAMKSMDITQLECEDNSFDCVLCYHVLEHVTDDDKALEELYRVLKPGGWAIIQVPIDKGREKTLEGTHISDPKKRRELFGQEDHFRSYGLDYPLKLARKGFQVTRDDFARHLSKNVTDSYRIFQDEEIFYCRKPQDASPTGHKKNENTISNASICHLVYEHEFIETYNRLISENFDISEHLFIVYSSHSWESDKKFNLSNSYYIHDFKDERLLNYLSKARLIVAHCLYHSSLISFLFENKKLLGKLVWKLWGGDLYLYRQAGTKANPFDNEEKRKQVIKNIGFIASPVEDEFNHIREIYKTNAQYLFAFYPSFVDYREIRLPETHRNDSTLNILVGNSAYPTSNHLQAFSLLEKYAGQLVRIYCPLSYGDKKYAEEISTAGKKIFGDKFIPMLDFLPFDKYVEFLSTIDIAVMNHDRQQALGNILTLLHLGKKVYLRQEITSYKSLKKLGFSLSTISSLQTDDFADLSRFSKNEAKCNSSLIVKLFSRKNCVEAWRKVFETSPSENKEPGARQPYGKLVGNTSTRPGEERGKNTAQGRVLFINHSIPPYEISGTPISTLNHVQGMKDLEYETAALIPAPDIESGFSKDQTGGYTLYRVKRFDKYEAFLGIIEQSRLREYFNVIEQILNDFNPDIVHINDYVYMPAELVEFLKKKNLIVIRNVCNCEELCHMDYPVTRSEFRGALCSGPETTEKCAKCFMINRLDRNNYTPEELNYFTGKIRERHRYIGHLYRTAVDGVTFTEASFKDYFTKYVEIPEDKVTVIPRGIPPFQADEEASAPRMETEEVKFAFIGNIMFCKGIDVALQAFETIKDKDNFRLDIFGAAVNREYLQWMQSLEKEYPDKFKYHGKYDKGSFGDIVKNIDICIVPSYFDTYNRIIREVMRYGVPVIATDFFGASIIQHGVNGLKFPVGDHRQLSEIMKNLADKPSMIGKLSDGALNTKIPTSNDELRGLHEFYNKIRQSGFRKDNPVAEPASLCRLIAFHLPQFHPIPENDAWWGDGFTEWTNVRKAQPIFDGHYQPHVPTDLGYYNLSDPSALKAQAALAQEYGIYGFCFYHYWFNGKLLLETPLHQMLQSGQPDFPFCLCWANEDWTRSWDGKSGEILIGQAYSDADDIRHFYYLRSFFEDKRYIKVNGKPLFLVYRAGRLPDPVKTTARWREIARKIGLGELYLCRVESFKSEHTDPTLLGFDAAIEFQPDWSRLGTKLPNVVCSDHAVYSYESVVQNMLDKPHALYKRFPCVTPSWDNSPRRKSGATVITGSTPELYGSWLRNAINRATIENPDDNIVFINAWNEWGEGNHLEPDQRFGRKFLEETRKSLELSNNLKPLTVSPESFTLSVSIVIPVFNNLELTRQCLAALASNTPGELFELVIIDNASTDGTADFLKFLSGNVNVISNNENLGFAKACNQGAKVANGKYLVFLNNDTIPQRGWLEELLSFINLHPDAGVVGCKLLYPDNTVQHCGASMRHDGAFFRHQYKFLSRCHPIVNQVRELDAVTAACFITPRDIFFQIGGFDELYLNGCEDMDYCTAVREAGYKIYYNHGSELYHLESQTPRANDRDKENFARYLSKWGAWRMKNEIEVYAEDGFWQKSGSTFTPSPQATERLRELVETTSPATAQEISSRIFPIMEWEKGPAHPTRATKILYPTRNKILFVCHDFPPYRYAGAQLYAMNLAKELNNTGLAQVDILHSIFREGYDRYEIIEAEFEGLKVYRLSKDITVGFDNSVSHPEVARLLDKFFSEHHYDAIHIHGLGQLSAVPIEIAKLHGIPTIMTLHDYWLLCAFWHLVTPDQQLCSGPESTEKCSNCFLKYHDFSNSPENLPEITLNFMRKRAQVFHSLFSKLDYAFAPSSYLADIFSTFGFRGIKVNPLGMPPMMPVAKTPRKRIVFGFIGQIIPRKGLETLLTAFSRITAQDVFLEIWGKSDNKAYLDSLLEFCAKLPNISYRGSYTPEQLPQIFSGIDLAVVPSLMENYPLVVQEAFMNATPVVASNAGGIPEVVVHNHNGLLFEVGNATDLEEKLCELIANPAKIAELSANMPTVKTIADDAAFFLDVYQQLQAERNHVPSRMHSVRILFYFFKNVHIPILKPIYEACKRLRPEVEVGFACLPHAPEMRAGFLAEELDQIYALGERIYPTPQEFRPDITFIADSVYPWVQGCGKLVHVGHGVLSKGQYYTDTKIARREEQADLVCVPGFHHAAVMKSIISKPVIATGMAKLDPLFSGRMTRDSELKRLYLPPHFRYVLFSPTFNDELSAIPFVTDAIHKVLPDEHTVLLIKLHGSTQAKYKELYRKLGKTHPRVYYCTDLDITPFLAIADVMISDVSSSMMEFAALDKPLVLFNNPNWTSYQNYNPSDIEFAWRDIGIQVHNLDEMRQAVRRSLEYPDEYSEKRSAYTDMLFANKRNGDGADRIVSLTLGMFGQPKHSPFLLLNDDVPLLNAQFHLLDTRT